MRVGTSNTGRHMLALTALLTWMPSVTAGQSLIVDEGSFEITIAGRLAGTEDFVIRRSGSGLNSQTIATAEITIAVPEGRSDLRPALQMVGGGMTVSAYQMKLSGTREEEVFVTVAPDRFLLRLRSERGEQERELRAAPGTLVLDTDVAHQHYFLSQRLLATGRSLPVIVPRQGEQYEVRVVSSDREPLQIAGQAIESRHLRLLVGQEEREVWIDSEGRVLRVTDSSSGYTAVRTSPP